MSIQFVSKDYDCQAAAQASNFIWRWRCTVQVIAILIAYHMLILHMLCTLAILMEEGPIKKAKDGDSARIMEGKRGKAKRGDLTRVNTKWGASFAGNFSTQKRKSFFNHSGEGMAVPCGFLREFPIEQSDKLAMDKCSGVVVVSAVFGDHDKIRQPKGLGSQTLETVCFFMFIDETTLKGLEKHKVLTRKEGEAEMIGPWRIAKILSTELPYSNPAMNGVIPKHLIHRLFPNAKFSIWLDAKLQLTVDPLLLIHSLIVSKKVDMALSKHPFNVHTIEEAMATARWRKWADVEALRLQMETYCENGLQPWTPSKLPYTTDVPDTALIVRRHGFGSNLFSRLLFNELEAFNPRDQLAFAFVRDLMSPKVKINMFEVEVFEQVTVEYPHNIKQNGTMGVATQQTKRASGREIGGSSCEGYLLKMWGESNDVDN